MAQVDDPLLQRSPNVRVRWSVAGVVQPFQDRHENKDAYDLIYFLLNFGDSPEDAGRHAAQSAIGDDDQVHNGLKLLAERFESAESDGPHAYSAFLDDGDTDEAARLRQEAVAVARQFLGALN